MKILKKLQLSALITGWFLLVGPGLPVRAQNIPLAVLPFELKADNRIYLKCTVNGSDTLSFLFDTGAEPMVINQNIIGNKLKMVLDGETNNMGAGGTNTVKVSNSNLFSFAGLNLDSVRFVAVPYPGDPFDGVFGEPLMKRYVIEINYAKRHMSFFDPATYVTPAADYERYSIRFLHGVPVIRAAVNLDGKRIRGNLELDTGGDGELSLSAPFCARYSFRTKLKAVATASSTGSDGSASEAPIVVLPELYLGHKQFYRVPAILSAAKAGVLAQQDLAGILGNNFLKRFDWILDLGHRQLWMKPNNSLYTPFYTFLNH